MNAFTESVRFSSPTSPVQFGLSELVFGIVVKASNSFNLVSTLMKRYLLLVKGQSVILI